MRKLRHLKPGATYHVTSQIDHGDWALQEAAIKQMFLDMVMIAKKKFQFKLWNFMIMDNHIHFLIKPGDGVSLSKIMQWLKCNFAKKWNKLHDRTGHLWGERFFSEIIEDESHLEVVSAYIDRNPVKANLVWQASDWQFGGLFHWLNGIKGVIDTWLEADFIACPG
ncbi:MAG: transposase [Treponema sp.]|jgi:REP element-mobilizing transposase RayT|nr:transposase [Treponema sp.]